MGKAKKKVAKKAEAPKVNGKKAAPKKGKSPETSPLGSRAGTGAAKLDLMLIKAKGPAVRMFSHFSSQRIIEETLNTGKEA